MCLRSWASLADICLIPAHKWTNKLHKAPTPGRKQVRVLQLPWPACPSALQAHALSLQPDQDCLCFHPTFRGQHPPAARTGGAGGGSVWPHVPGTSALCWRSPRSRVSTNQLVGINAPFLWTHRSCLPVSLQMRTDEVHAEELPCSANSGAVG